EPGVGAGGAVRARPIGAAPRRQPAGGAGARRGAGGGGMNPYRVAGFEEFWPWYVRMHSRPATQLLHALATAVAGTLLLSAIALRQPLLAVAAPAADYLIAQLAHRLWQRNATRPWRH